jgi:ketosteroid isomerase-like protein
MTQGEQRDTRAQSTPQQVFERMIQAANRHDLEAMVACYTSDYHSEQPFHPERNFTGPDGVRRNWSFFFATMPDYRIEVLSQTVDGATVWAELHFHGTQLDGTRQSTRGVTLVGVQGDLIGWARLYIESVQESGEVPPVR